MSNVTDIWLFVQTSTTPTNAVSSGHLQLNVVGAGYGFGTLDQQAPSNDLTKLGGSAQFHWSQGSDWPENKITTGNITGFSLAIIDDPTKTPGDAWLPASIWVTLLTDAGETDAPQYVLGPQCPNWSSSQWFSTDPTDKNSKQLWDLNWSHPAPLEFTSGAITDIHLEPNESTTYEFDVVNRTSLLDIDNISIAVVYDKSKYEGITMAPNNPLDESGYPLLDVGQVLTPAGTENDRATVTFPIVTKDATPGTYEFDLSLVGFDVDAASTTNVKLYQDDGQQFKVDPD